jgi:predicted Zn-dependent protease
VITITCRRVFAITLVFLLLISTVEITYASFTLEDEKKVGKEFYEKMVENKILVQDKRINDYMNQLGNLILSHSQRAPFEFKFSIIKSSAINAFATPGGYIYVNSGLFTILENEGELAGVLAHEIGHVNAHHIADIISKSQKVNIATLAAILAGIFLGGGQLAPAAISFSLATGTSLNLKYSREHEEEADKLGLSYLVDSGYDGMTMVDFLKTMKRSEYYSNIMPSYFLTHPGTEERIAYLDGLIQTRYHKKGMTDIIGRFKRIQAFILLNEANPETNIKHFQSNLLNNPNNVDDLYGLAINQEKLGQITKALASYQKALLLAPEDSNILRDAGIFCYKIGRIEEAILYLEKAQRITTDDSDTATFLGKAYIEKGLYKEALHIYSALEKKKIADPEIYYNLAMAYGNTNNPGESHYNFGIYFKKINKFESALFHFKEALKYFTADNEMTKEINQQISSLNAGNHGKSLPRKDKTENFNKQIDFF